MRTVLSRSAALAAACCVVVALAAPAALAQVGNLTLFQGGLSNPLYMVSPPGEPNRLMIVQRAGAIRVIENGVLLGTNFLTIPGVQTQNVEQGLLGLAFAPDYATSRRFYVNYVVPRGAFEPNGTDRGRTVVARYTTSANPNVANPAGEILFTVDQPFSNHNGGCLQFGPDGFLYCGMGDGGSGNDPGNRAQNINEILGKILRLNVSGAVGYTVPPSNPYVGIAGVDEIFMLGVRNPWRFSFDRLTGDLYIGDVGQDTQEEHDYFPAGTGLGANLGWRCMEGTFCTGLSGCTCNAPSLHLPIHTYAHGLGARSTTAGYVYRGNAIPRWRGRYFFADFITNQVWSFKVCGGVPTDLQEHTNDLRTGGNVTTIGGVASFAEDAGGELYLVEIFNGRITKISPQVPPGDWDMSGAASSADITAFLAQWFSDLSAGTTGSDFDGNCAVTSSDITSFLASWFASL